MVGAVLVAGASAAAAMVGGACCRRSSRRIFQRSSRTSRPTTWTMYRKTAGTAAPAIVERYGLRPLRTATATVTAAAIAELRMLHGAQ